MHIPCAWLYYNIYLKVISQIYTFWSFNDKKLPFGCTSTKYGIASYFSVCVRKQIFQREFCRGKILFPLIRHRIEDYRLHTLQKNCQKGKGGSLIS